MKKTTLIATAVAALFCAGSLMAPTADASTHRKKHHHHHHAKVVKQQPQAMAAADSNGVMWHDAAGPKVQHGMCWVTGGGKHGEGFWKACK